MHFLTFEIVLVLFWVIIPITLEQTENSLDSNPENDPQVLISSADLPSTESGDYVNSDVSFVDTGDTGDLDIAFTDSTQDATDPNGPSGSSSVESTQSNEPQYLPNPALLADDEVPPLELYNPPCSFGNPMTPGRNGEPAKPLDPNKPLEPSKQLFCCINNFLNCVKFFMHPDEDNHPSFDDKRCSRTRTWSCCVGIKNGVRNSLRLDGEGIDCEKASFRAQADLDNILQQLEGADEDELDFEIPNWFKNLVGPPQWCPSRGSNSKHAKSCA